LSGNEVLSWLNAGGFFITDHVSAVWQTSHRMARVPCGDVCPNALKTGSIAVSSNRKIRMNLDGMMDRGSW
jgi:hypothetical protein